MPKFAKEFHTLNYAISGSENILLFAHTRPDGDTIGSVLALNEYIKSLGKKADVACFDPMPEYLKTFSPITLIHPDELELEKYKLIIAADSVERGFEKVLPKLSPDQVTAIIDHHPDITIKCDITIIDPAFSSVCEMVYEFFIANNLPVSREASTFLMLGIIADTGVLQHSNTTSHVLGIISELLKKGAPMGKIINATFSSKKISTLKLWGRAFERARINQENGMIASILTKDDIREFGATTEDIAQVATILNTVPGTKFSLVLSERDDGIIKGSLRSEKYKGVNVSTLAAQFGGGGHELASGFEIKGKIVETENGWKIE